MASCGFVSLKGGIDTDTATGRFTFASLAEFEREIIRERKMVGLEAARSRGRKGGRPAGLTKETLATAKNTKILYDSGKRTVKEIAESLEISSATCYRYIDIIKEMEKKKRTKTFFTSYKKQMKIQNVFLRRRQKWLYIYAC